MTKQKNFIRRVMVENSNEEDIKMLEKLDYLLDDVYSTGLVEDEERNKYQYAIEHILSDYKRVLKENEELKQEKINNYRMIALAQNEALGYMQGYEDGKKLKTSAIASIVENQQYYIIKKQMEKYEEHIAKLQKENEELKNNTRKNENELEFDVDCDWIALQKILDKSEKSNEYISYKNEKWINEKYCIPIQKIKNKMKKEIETNEHIILGGRRNGKTLEYGKRLGRIEMCQELLEGRK